MKKLSAKQKRFADEYLVDFNIIKAAKRANYAPFGSSIRTLEMPHVARYIAARHGDISAKLKVDAEWVLKELVSVYRKCMQLDDILDKNGKQTKGKFDPRGANRALDSIGRHMAVQAFKDRLEVSGTADKPVVMWGVAKKLPPLPLLPLPAVPLPVISRNRSKSV
jgi:phage terminase small subunit